MTVLKWYFSAREYSNPRKWSFYRALIWIFEEQDENQMRSPIATLAKAEILAKTMKRDESKILENPRSEEFIQVGNIDWRLEISPIKISVCGVFGRTDAYQRWAKVSQMKLKICELATGNNVTEEWTFLPKNRKYYLSVEMSQFYENFALLYFSGGQKILLLNLATRKQFWVDSEKIINKMKAKAPVDAEVDLLNIIRSAQFDSYTTIGQGIGIMEVGSNKIEVKYTVYAVLMEYGDVALGSYKNYHIKISTLLRFNPSIYNPSKMALWNFGWIAEGKSMVLTLPILI